MAAYKFYLDDMMLPITPGKLEWAINGRNDSIDLADGTEFPVKVEPGLTTFSFEFELPHRHYPHANAYYPPEYYLAKIEAMFLQMADFYFVVTRNEYAGSHPYAGLKAFSTNMLVHIDEYDVTEDAENAGDLTVSLTLTKSVTKEMVIAKVNAPAVPVKPPPPPTPPPKAPVVVSPPAQKSYTIKYGDTLWGIARRYVGDGARYPEIMAVNHGLPDGNPPNYIYPGRTIVLPVGW